MRSLASAFARSPFDFLERPRSVSSNSALLLELFPARLEHLIVRCFFLPIGDQMFANRLFVFFHSRSRNAMPAIVWRYSPFGFEFDVLVIFLRRRCLQLAQQFLARLLPISVRKFVGFAFVDPSNLLCSPLD